MGVTPAGKMGSWSCAMVLPASLAPAFPPRNCPFLVQSIFLASHKLPPHFRMSDIDVEHPAPAVVVGDPAAGDGPKHRRHHDARRPESHGLASFFGRKSLQQDGLRERLQAASTSALNEAKNDEESERWRKPAEERSSGE